MEHCEIAADLLWMYLVTVTDLYYHEYNCACAIMSRAFSSAPQLIKGARLSVCGRGKLHAAADVARVEVKISTRKRSYSNVTSGGTESC